MWVGKWLTVKYKEEKFLTMATPNGENITQRDTSRLVAFWQATLSEYQYIMGTSQQVMVRETISCMELLAEMLRKTSTDYKTDPKSQT